MTKVDKKILVVDDDLITDKMLVFLLERRGFKVEFADSGKHALELLEHFKPNAIMLDLLMPHMDGFELCQKINKDANLKDIPIICLSSLSANEHKERAFSVGACAYIEKPFSTEELVEKIEGVIK